MNRFSDDWYREEWRRLGFYYDRDDDARLWMITGSAAGLGSFVQALRDYADNPENDWISCHRNFAPHDYLKIGTWNEPVIDGQWIAGPQCALRALANDVQSWIASARAGDRMSVRSIYAPRAPYDLCLQLASDDFDPASLDPSLQRK